MKTLDSPISFLQSRHVQPIGLNRLVCDDITLDARDQRPTGWLNLARCILPGVAPRGSCLYPDNKGYSHFLLLNRGTVTRHRLIGTCAAPLRRVLRLGHAGTSKPTGQQDREKFCSLGAVQNIFPCPPNNLSSGWPTWNMGTQRCSGQHSGNRPFLFLFLFRSDNSHMKRLRDNSTYFFRGAFFVFSLFLSLLVRLNSGTL